MIRLEMICVNPDAPEFAKPHPKAEVIWNQQFQQFQTADLTDYPNANEDTELFVDGKSDAQEMARLLNMAPDDEVEVFEAQWIFEPLAGHQLYQSDVITSQKEDHCTDTKLPTKSFSTEATELVAHGSDLTEVFESVLQDDTTAPSLKPPKT